MSEMALRPIRIVVTGGRRYNEEQIVYAALDLILRKRGIEALAHGATPTLEGADWIADEWAKRNGIMTARYPADPDIDGVWPGAGPARNRRMIEAFRPDYVVAFPGGNGTESCTRIASEFSVPVWRPVR